MFCITSHVKSWKALIFTSENGTIISARPTALDATREVTAKYENIPPMSKSGRPIEQPIDVIEAEKRFGISFFTGFSHILIRNGQYHMVLEARFQGDPDKTHFVSCPKSVRDSDLSKEDQELLKCKLEGVKGRIAETVWNKLKKRYDIVKGDWLATDKEEEI
ncbi:hypothetical protein CBS63078_11232 [Aspergillus niger]|nr:hypothetical protein CBS13152_11184 [Aspergillus niger]GLA78806.1 hypothetical protein AtubIFM55763_000698 [Aspergillus tubingensis]KAI2869434.1 hypothetical protein CBS11852_11230 [Aspergillus niger]KAI2885287.1 hypothetical protein CBS63078_11232 [Aspergillus niger]KAI3015017.1 hypothetical protein CBS147347_11331 [Aspergillus niger]